MMPCQLRRPQLFNRVVEIVGMENEIWKPVVGAEAFYHVSSLGRIKSLPRIKKNCKCSYLTKELILKPGTNRNGYRHAVLVVEDKNRLNVRIHQCVAEAFIGARNGLDTDHINGDRGDNRSSNLQYITRRENTNKGGASRLKNGKKFSSTGVYYEQDRDKWRSAAYIDGKTRFLGRFKTEKEASDAYINATT